MSQRPFPKERFSISSWTMRRMTSPRRNARPCEGPSGRHGPRSRRVSSGQPRSFSTIFDRGRSPESRPRTGGSGTGQTDRILVGSEPAHRSRPVRGGACFCLDPSFGDAGCRPARGGCGGSWSASSPLASDALPRVFPRRGGMRFRACCLVGNPGSRSGPGEPVLNAGARMEQINRTGPPLHPHPGPPSRLHTELHRRAVLHPRAHLRRAGGCAVELRHCSQSCAGCARALPSRRSSR